MLNSNKKNNGVRFGFEIALSLQIQYAHIHTNKHTQARTYAHTRTHMGTHTDTHQHT